MAFEEELGFDPTVSEKVVCDAISFMSPVFDFVPSPRQAAEMALFISYPSCENFSDSTIKQISDLALKLYKRS